jgi:hypothetical protein
VKIAKLFTLVAVLALTGAAADAQQAKTISASTIGNGPSMQSDRSQSMELPIRSSTQLYNGRAGTWVTGGGSATETDKATAISEATDGATEKLNSACVIGVIVQVVKLSTSCDQQDDGNGNAQYDCIVEEKGLCR